MSLVDLIKKGFSADSATATTATVATLGESLKRTVAIVADVAVAELPARPDPGKSQPVASQPVASQSAASQSAASQPAASQPAANVPADLSASGQNTNVPIEPLGEPVKIKSLQHLANFPAGGQNKNVPIEPLSEPVKTHDLKHLANFPAGGQKTKVFFGPSGQPENLRVIFDYGRNKRRGLSIYEFRLAAEAERRAVFCENHRQTLGGVCQHFDVIERLATGDPAAALDSCLLWRLVRLI